MEIEGGILYEKFRDKINMEWQQQNIILKKESNLPQENLYTYSRAVLFERKVLYHIHIRIAYVLRLVYIYLLNLFTATMQWNIKNADIIYRIREHVEAVK